LSARLSCYHGRRSVVEDVSFEVRRGEILALMGLRAPGDDLLRALNRLHELTPNARIQGSVLLNDVTTAGTASVVRN